MSAQAVTNAVGVAAAGSARGQVRRVSASARAARRSASSVGVSAGGFSNVCRISASGRSATTARAAPKGARLYNRSMAAIRPKVEKLREGFTQKEFRDALPFLRALRVWMSEIG